MTDYRKMIADQQDQKRLRDQRVREEIDRQTAMGRTVTGRIPGREPIMHSLPRTGRMMSGDNYMRQAQSAERVMRGMEALLIASGWERVHDSFFMTNVDRQGGDVQITVEKSRKSDNPLGPLRYDHPTGRLAPDKKAD